MLPDIVLPTLEFKPLEGFEVTLKTITPMFGGGPVARTVDQVQPIHASGVRGHLRFWWRATKGATYDNPEELQKAEEDLWGSATNHGKVVTRVHMQSKGIEVPYANLVSGFGDAKGYALFPFAENKKEGTAAAKGQQNVQFTVKVVAPNMYHAELSQAMAAWVQFGGVGSRTRRGCGSLEWVAGQALPTVLAVSKQPAMAKLSTLPQTVYLAAPVADATKAWQQVLAMYKGFRQSRNEGKERNRPGRSKWPEPDTIRLIARTHSHRHEPSHSVRGFPRADLGLPVIFHFKDEREGDPKDHTLELSGGRFASPVVTKVVKTAKGYQPMLAVLQVPHVWELGEVLLKGQVVDANVTQATEPLHGKPVREALVQFYKQAGYQEVKL